MAQLTWRNVDAPDFGSSTASLRLAGDSLNRGFESARRSIDDYEAGETQSESAKLMAAVMGAKDPSQLQSVIAGFDPRYLTADSLNFAAGRPQQMADLTKTGVYTDGLRQDQAFAAERQPLLVQGDRLLNTGRDIQNRSNRETLDQNIYVNDRTRSQDAAKGPWNQRAAQIQALAMQGDAASLDQLARMQSDPELASLATAAGVNVLDFIKTTTDGAKTGKLAETIRSTNFDEVAKSRFNQIIGSGVSNDAEVAKIIQDIASTDGPEVAAKVAENWSKNKGVISPAPDVERMRDDVVAARAGARVPGIVYQNNGVRNQKLAPTVENAITQIAGNLGLTPIVSSGGQSSNQPGQGTGSTRHNHGGAGDVMFRMADGSVLDQNNPQHIPIFRELAKQAAANGLQGLGAGEGYMNSRTMHIGGGTPGVWGAGGKGANAPAWLREAWDEGRQIYNANGGKPVGATPAFRQAQGNALLQTASTGAAAPQGSRAVSMLAQAAGIPAANAAAAPVQTPAIALPQAANLSGGDWLEDYDKGQEPIRVGNSFLFESQTDRSLNGLNPILDVIADPNHPNAKKPVGDMAREIHKRIGDTDEGGWFSSTGITEEQLVEGINTVRDRYGIAPHVASEFISNALAKKMNVFSANTRKIDWNVLDREVGEIYDTSGKGGLTKKGVAQLEAIKLKGDVENLIKKQQERINRAQEDLAKAANNPRADLENARKRHLAITSDASNKIAELGKNDAIRINGKNRLDITGKGNPPPAPAPVPAPGSRANPAAAAIAAAAAPLAVPMPATFESLFPPGSRERIQAEMRRQMGMPGGAPPSGSGRPGTRRQDLR